MDAGEAFRAAVVFGDRAELDAPPEAAVDLDVPIFPTGIDRVVPAFVLEGLDGFLEEGFAAVAVFAPEADVCDAAAGAFEIFFRAGDDGGRGAFEFEPGEVAGPAADEGLGEGEEGDEEPGRDGVVLGLEPGVDHVGEGHEERAADHEVGDDSQERNGNRAEENECGERDPLDAAEVGGDIGLRGGVDRLEKALAEDAVVDHGFVDEPGEARCAVDLAFPFRGAGGAEEDEVLEAQHRLGLAVALLLFAKRFEREAAVVPDDGGGAEGDDAAALLEAPAEVHIVAGLAVFVVEAADLVERPTVESHVAAGNVLGDDIGEEHMARTAGGRGHTGLHPIFRRRRDVRAADAREVAAEKRADQVIEPVGIGHAVAVCVNDDLAGGGVGADIAGETEAFVFLADIFDPRVAGRDLLRVVGRAVVDEDDFVVGVVDLFERGEAAVEGFRAVVGADDDGGLRVGGKLHARGHGTVAREEVFYGFERGFFCAVAAHEAERPVENFLASAEPFIGPRVDDCAGETAADDAFDVPAEHFGLLLLGVANGVHAEFAEDERLVVGEILQAGEVAVEVVLAVQVDIEGDEVAVLREEVFGGRVARVGEQGAGIGLASDLDQLLDKLGDLARAEPADHGCRNFVSHEVAEDGGVAGIFGDAVADGFFRLVADFSIVEKFEVFGPGDRDEGADAAFGAEVEEPARGDIVDADEVDARLDHEVEIGGGLGGSSEMLALGIGGERAVGGAFDEKLFVAFEEKFRAHAHGQQIAHGGRI